MEQAVEICGETEREVQTQGDRKPLVLLLHGSAGTSALWRSAPEAFAPMYRVIAPDLIGYGKSAAWPDDAPFSLLDEVKRISRLIPCCERRFDLVGYSYGGAVALELARSNPVRIRTLTLIEPVFFSALKYGAEREAYAELLRVRSRFEADLRSGSRETAMRDFIDFWTGRGAWDALPPSARAGMLQMAAKIRLDWEASFAADPGPALLRDLGPKTLLVRGDRSPAPMIRLVDALHALMPGSSRVVVTKANHLLPLTHGAELIAIITEHYHAHADRTLR